MWLAVSFTNQNSGDLYRDLNELQSMPRKKKIFFPVTMVFPHAVYNRKYVYPRENLFLNMSYSCQFCT